MNYIIMLNEKEREGEGREREDIKQIDAHRDQQ